MRMAAIGAKGFVALAHRHAEPRRNDLLADRQIPRAFDHVLKKEIEGALLAVTDFNLKAEKLASPVKPCVVVLQPVARKGRILQGSHVGRFPPNGVTTGNCQRTAT